MKKSIILTITIIALIAIGLNITGFATNDPDAPEIKVIRSPITKNQTENITVVMLTIISSENVVAIKETFIPADCEILDTYSEPEIDIFEVNEAEQTWIIANRSDTLSVDMYYFLTYECNIDETAGEVFILTDDDQLSSGTFDQNDDTTNTPSAGVSPGTGSPSGGGGSTSGGGSSNTGTTSGLTSTPIQQTETQEEFDEVVETATRNILGLDASKQVDTNSLVIWLALGIIILIILIVLAYSLFKKTEDFPKKPAQKFQ